MAQVVNRYHCDVDFNYPNGTLGMSQTLSYHSKEDAEAEASALMHNMIEAGCTDIKIYVREIRVRKEDWDD